MYVPKTTFMVDVLKWVKLVDKGKSRERERALEFVSISEKSRLMQPAADNSLIPVQSRAVIVGRRR